MNTKAATTGKATPGTRMYFLQTICGARVGIRHHVHAATHAEALAYAAGVAETGISVHVWSDESDECGDKLLDEVVMSEVS